MAELKKRDMSVNVYFHKMKALADELTSIGQPLRDDELISYILAGLPKEFDVLYEVVNNRTTPMQVRDLYSQLQATEHRHNSRRPDELHYPAAHYAAPPSPLYGAAAHAAAYGQPRSQPFYHPDARPPPPSYQPKAPAAPPGAKPNTGGRTTVICQLYGIPRHTASKCFKRFNRDFLGIGNDGSNTEKQIAMAANSVVAFSAHGAPGAQTQTYVDPAWYADSGTTHHITHDLDKLTTKEPYHGTEHVHTANGAGMRIHNIGHAILPTPSSKQLELKKILHVPQAHSNLLSMSKLSKDNNVFIELHPNDLFVKDLDTKEPILRGRCHGGLYEIKAPVIKQALSSVKVSHDMWHSRLGHPASQVVQHVLRSHDLPSTIMSNKHTAVCDACQQGKSHQLPFPLSTRVTKHPLEIIYSDVWGPAQVSVSGHRFYVSFVDAYSRFTWLYLIKHKSDVYDVFL
jgi:histone deacetylase 1/2